MLTSRRPKGDGVLFRQLECFLAVARLGNLSRAAEEMYLTQPTLTARLKALEEELGDPLFVRTSRGMRVTEAGREFLPYAERIVGGFEEGKRPLEELRGAAQDRGFPRSWDVRVTRAIGEVRGGASEGFDLREDRAFRGDPRDDAQGGGAARSHAGDAPPRDREPAAL